MDAKPPWRPAASGLPSGRDCGQHGNTADGSGATIRVMERLRPRLAVPGTPAALAPGPLGAHGRPGSPGRRAGGARSGRRGAGRRGGAGPVHHLRGQFGRRGRAHPVRGARPDRGGPGRSAWARGLGRTGDLALLAGFTWFAPVWAAWQDGPPLVPSLAMVAGGFTFPLVVHLVLAYPSGRAGSAPARVLVAAVYAEALLAAAVLALFRDPYLDPGCLANCNVNVFLVRSAPLPGPRRRDRRPLVRRSRRGRAHRDLRGAAGGGLAARPAQARCRSPSPRSCSPPRWRRGRSRCSGPRSRTRSTPPCSRSSPPPAPRSSLLAAGLISGVARARAERRAIARIAANLGEAPAPGTSAVRAGGGAARSGPADRLLAPRRAAVRRRSGRAVPEPVAGPGRTVTRLTRDGRHDRRGLPRRGRSRAGEPPRARHRARPGERTAASRTARPARRASRVPGPHRGDRRCRTPQARAGPARWRPAAPAGPVLRHPARPRQRARPTATPTAQHGPRHGGRARPKARSRNCANSPTGSIPRCWPRPG